MTSSWKTILVSTLPQDIYLAEAFLKSEDIPTFLRDELTAQVYNFYSNAIGGVKLQVREEDVPRALELLREAGYIREPRDHPAPPETIQTRDRTHCPYCGSDDIGKKKEVDGLILAFYFLLGIFFPIFKPVYGCRTCGRSWKYRK